MEPVYFVGAGPGDPDLITVKGKNLLVSADVLIYTGSLVNPDLVSQSRAEIRLDSFGMKLPEMVETMSRYAKEGKRVVRLHSGDPAIFGAIVEQIEGLAREGLRVEVVPGVSSMFGAAAALQTQLTLGGVADTVIVTRPAGATLERDEIRDLSRHQATMVFFLGTEKLEEIVTKVDCPPDTPAAVVYHATWPDQKVVRGTVADIAEKTRDAGITKTALLIIGGVLDPSRHGHRRSVLYS
jgi:precorrin-4/cobalt-precorrin-4 C11-methyltransferase